jgi:hypothetical protein
MLTKEDIGLLKPFAAHARRWEYLDLFAHDISWFTTNVESLMALEHIIVLGG